MEQLCAAIGKVWCKNKEIEMIGTFFLTACSFVNALETCRSLPNGLPSFGEK
jgi:hypothetical protein